MRDDADRFERAGARVVVIGLGKPEFAARFCQRRRIPFDCVVQPDRSAHRAFGLRRGRVTQVAGPAVWLPWLRNQVTGKAQGRFGQGDPAQLPGTFVVDTEGRVRYGFRARRSSEIPANREILDALAALKEAG